MPKRYSEEFKKDVVAVARRGDLTILEVATGVVVRAFAGGCAKPTVMTGLKME